MSMSKDIYQFTDDFNEFKSKGGQLIFSFGGAAGVYLELLLSEDKMFEEIVNVLDKTGCRALDWDIEGGIIGDIPTNTKRAKVIKRLQDKYPGLYISYTLAADRFGIPFLGINLLKNALENGVKINMVNIMAMNISRVDPGKWGEAASNMGDTTVMQLKNLWPTLTTQQIYKMLGITVMIGRNDDGSVFQESDATVIAQYAKDKNIGLLSFWSINRDQILPQGSSGDNAIYSQVNTKDFEFFNRMKAIVGVDGKLPNSSITPPTDPPVDPPVEPPTDPTDPPTPPTDPSKPPPLNPDSPIIKAWTPSTYYRTGSQVSYKDVYYVAVITHLSQFGFEPSDLTTELWRKIATPKDPNNSPPPKAEEWIVGKEYKVNDRINYKKKRYLCIKDHTSAKAPTPWGSMGTLWSKIPRADGKPDDDNSDAPTPPSGDPSKPPGDTKPPPGDGKPPGDTKPPNDDKPLPDDDLTKYHETETGYVVTHYHTNWSNYAARNFQVKDLPIDYMHTVAYAFFDCKEDGQVLTIDPYADFQKNYTDGIPPQDTWNDPEDGKGNFGQFTKLKKLGHKFNFQLSVGGWTLSKAFSPGVSSQINRQRFVDTTLALFNKYPIFNGINVDWEYVSAGINYSLGDPANKVSPDDDKNCLELFKMLRKALDNDNKKHYKLSLCVVAAPEKLKFDIASYVPYVDEFHVMTYDFNHSGFSDEKSTHAANLYDNPKHTKYSVDKIVNILLDKKIPSRKIMIGCAAYARGGIVENDIGSKYTGPNPYFPTSESLSSYKLFPKPGGKMIWDEIAQAEYEYDAERKIFTSYDTVRSMEAKIKYIKEKNLLGCIIWESSDDRKIDDPLSLTKVLYDGLLKK